MNNKKRLLRGLIPAYVLAAVCSTSLSAEGVGDNETTVYARLGYSTQRFNSDINGKVVTRAPVAAQDAQEDQPAVEAKDAVVSDLNTKTAFKGMKFLKLNVGVESYIDNFYGAASITHCFAMGKGSFEFEGQVPIMGAEDPAQHAFIKGFSEKEKKVKQKAKTGANLTVGYACAISDSYRIIPVVGVDFSHQSQKWKVGDIEMDRFLPQATRITPFVGFKNKFRLSDDVSAFLDIDYVFSFYKSWEQVAFSGGVDKGAANVAPNAIFSIKDGRKRMVEKGPRLKAGFSYKIDEAVAITFAVEHSQYKAKKKKVELIGKGALDGNAVPGNGQETELSNKTRETAFSLGISCDF